MEQQYRTAAAAIGSVQEEQAAFAELGAAQWKLVHAFERHYIGKRVHGTGCAYDEDNWFNLDGSVLSRSGINWSRWSHTPALRILLKGTFFDSIFARALELSSAKANLCHLQRTILPVIESKKLLTGQPREVLLGLSHLTDDDLLLMLDAELVEAPSESNFCLTCSALKSFLTYARSYSERVPVFESRARLPWQKSGETMRGWAKRRAKDLQHVFPKIEGYEPMTADTVQPLVERSLALIDDHFDHFNEIGQLVAEYTAQQDSDGRYVLRLGAESIKHLLQKFSPIFGHIIPPPDLNEITHSNPDTKHHTAASGRAVFLWLRALVKLCRAACMNIIFLTTGLRNHDIRNLRVGTCRPSGRVDILFYLHAGIQKTKNFVVLPVPPQAEKAIRLLTLMKDTDSGYLIDWGGETRKSKTQDDQVEKDEPTSLDDTHLKSGNSINSMIREFADHFGIPFVDTKGEEFTAHNYRSTVAGWLGAASNLALLMVRRLFGHSNNIMPTVYLRNNPSFIAERQAQKERTNNETARQMARAAAQGRVAGVKGEQLERGYQANKSRMESDPRKSHSLTDAEIMSSFAQLLEQRLASGSMCGFLTPFGVRCGRNPTDSSQPPCARRAHADKTRDVAVQVLRHASDIDPQNCIGTSCSEAMLGPWSTAVLDTLEWYRALLRHQFGSEFSEDHFVESAKQFIRQYESPLKKVFGLRVGDANA